MFHENLKEIRKNKGFSQEQLAVRINVTRQTVSKWEKGLSVPDAELLIEISEVLNVPVSTLLGKEIQNEDQNKESELIASELAKLNELLVVYGEKASQLKKKIITAIAVILLLVFVLAIFDKWTGIWHAFGENLYYLINN